MKKLTALLLCLSLTLGCACALADTLGTINMNGAFMLNGTMPVIKLVGSVADPDAKGSERIEIYDVTFDEVTLMKFENATVGEEEVPFKAGGFRYIDTITA